MTLFKDLNLLESQIPHMQNHDYNVLCLIRLFGGNDEIICFDIIFLKSLVWCLEHRRPSININYLHHCHYD